MDCGSGDRDDGSGTVLCLPCFHEGGEAVLILGLMIEIFGQVR